MATSTTTDSAATATDYELVIGLEVHAQLRTQSKMFCGCSSDYANAAPNSHCCPICMGYPGVLPVINSEAIDKTIMTALALNCEIPEFSKFDRKNYGYPDLPKGYQISQYDRPLSRDGFLTVEVNGEQRRIGITRVHLEEDTGRLLHRNEAGASFTLVDLNRAGVPLMEIVGEPDIRSAEEARLYMEKLRQILLYLGVSSGRMEEGALRCDANVSVRPRGSSEFGVKTEIKNMNSFRAVERAIAYEAQRQIEILRSGGTIEQETRGWVEDKGITVSQRSKEYAQDYRYFPEPDLPPLVVSREWVERIRAQMPELPDARRERFERAYSLAHKDAVALTAERELADYYEDVLRAGNGTGAAGTPERAKTAANWVLGDLRRLLNAEGLEITASRVKPGDLAALLAMLDAGKISGKQAKDVLEKAFAGGESPAAIVEREGIAQLADTAALERVVDEVIAENPKAVEDYQTGKTAAVQFLVGQVMKRTKGSAKPDIVRPILLGKLGQP
ncbi:MAG TPA: Asp-tRNA(Asn)/Glu-tRNA(Gln) amidotransferase subunit GatB [Ktedonobacterales bacterium]|nr:Asp-tRNA(Asn)/Glu-tRNA(Gln) amidotransferase subunit GatB [Ktedonobacterales bacterium]